VLVDVYRSVGLPMRAGRRYGCRVKCTVITDGSGTGVTAVGGFELIQGSNVRWRGLLLLLHTHAHAYIRQVRSWFKRGPCAEQINANTHGILTDLRSTTTGCMIRGMIRSSELSANESAECALQTSLAQRASAHLHSQAVASQSNWRSSTEVIFDTSWPLAGL